VTARRRGAGAALLFAMLVVAMSIVAPVFASAQSARATTTCTAPQVAVAVNLAGTKTVGCANYSSGLTGWTLLQRAGFTVTGTDAYPDTFVCQIDAIPTDAVCATTPSGSDSWSYWHAAPGATQWTFSTHGAAGSYPEPGSADAWNLGQSAPDFPPQSVLPRPAAVTHAPIAPIPTTPAPANRPPPVSVPSVTPAPTTPTGRQSAPPSALRSAPHAAPDSSSSSAAAGIENVHPAAATQHTHGSSAWPAVGGLIAVLVVAGGGGAIAWRRRVRP
jgi:hypothetical protein